MSSDNNQNNQSNKNNQKPAAANSMMNQAKQAAGQKIAVATPQDKIKNLRAMMKKSSSQLEMVLQTPEKVKRFQREFMTMVQGNATLLDCEAKSLVAAAIQSAQLNLSLDKNMGQAYVVPYKKNAQFQIGYLGYMTLARRSGEIKSLRTEIVYAGDKFHREYNINGVEFTHVPCPPSERGEKVGVYMIAHYTNGGSHFGFMFAEEVDEVRKLSKAAHKEDSIWNIHEEAMWKKTVIKREAKYLPLSVEAQRAARIDELQDAGVDVQADVIDVDEE
jgi:recombination protein RecT